MSLLERGSSINDIPRGTLANPAAWNDPAIAFAQPALLRQVAHP